jgi:hypothetical protein
LRAIARLRLSLTDGTSNAPPHGNIRWGSYGADLAVAVWRHPPCRLICR